MKYTKYRNCLICKKENYNIWAKKEDYIVVKCNECGFAWANPFFDVGQEYEIYKDYIGTEHYNGDKKGALRTEQYKSDIRFINLCAGNKYKNVLDFGCADGEFLNFFNDNIKKFGFDVDLNAINIGKKNKKIIFNNTWEYEKNSFDLVVLRGVLQHFLDPESSINNIYDVLKKNKFLYVGMTPNFGSFCSFVFKEKWNLVSNLFLSYFDEKNIVEFFNNHGFGLVYKDFPYFDSPYKTSDDYCNIVKFILGDGSFCPAFLGNMMSLMFVKK